VRRETSILRKRQPFFPVLWLACLLLSLPVSAQSSYLKVVRDQGNVPQKLQTGIARFRSSQGQTVDLVAVIHVADSSYYDRLNKHFQQYDSVLYEMVLDVPKSVSHQNDVRELLGREKKEPKIDTTRGGKDPLSLVQKKLASTLGLAFQMEHIDYSPDNFRHADLTLKEFEDAMASKGESPLSLFQKLLKGDDHEAPKEYRELSKLPMLKILTQGPNAEEQKTLKTGLATYFAQARDYTAEAQGEVLIGMRNQKAIEVLQQRVQKGDKSLAIFYGAAHMPDLAQRLRDQGFRPISRNWVSAWALQ
jgi:TraB/PrgY/gumN family